MAGVQYVLQLLVSILEVVVTILDLKEKIKHECVEVSGESDWSFMF